MKKLIFTLLAAVFVPQIAHAQVMFAQSGGSAYDNVPNGYRVFPLPLEIYKLKGIQKEHRVDVFATFNKKGKISALMAEMKAAQKSETLGAVPLIFKTDADDEFVTVLLLQNIKVLYIPAFSSTYANDYPEAGVEIKYSEGVGMPSVSDKISAKEKVNITSLAKTAIVRLLLTPEEAQLAAHAVATDMKLALVIRNSADEERKVLAPVDMDTFKKK